MPKLLHTYETACGSGNMAPEGKNIPLERILRTHTLMPSGTEGGHAMRQVQLLTMGFILAFLGAIVVGVF